MRAFVLYHMFPYDKSMWKSVKDPYWVFFSCVSITPIVSQLWWMFLFFIKDKQSEHQVCEFIIGFKCAQFVSLGVIFSFLGIIKYLNCVVQSWEHCDTLGPRLNGNDMLFFILQIVIVWCAFLRLPYTRRDGHELNVVTTQLPFTPSSSSSSLNDQSVQSSSPSRSSCSSLSVTRDLLGNQVNLSRGGQLVRLFGYETISLCMVLMLLIGVVYCDFDTSQREALMYWIRTLYGLLSLPFLPFKIPILATILMHTHRMGYDEYGRTVPRSTTSNSPVKKSKHHSSQRREDATFAVN